MIVRSLDEDQSERTYAFRCATPQRAKQLWTLCVEHHSFFRYVCLHLDYVAYNGYALILNDRDSK